MTSQEHNVQDQVVQIDNSLNASTVAQSDEKQAKNNQSIRNLSFKQREDLIKKIYMEVLGKNPTYAEIDKFAYKDVTPDQIRLALLKSTEHSQLVSMAEQHKKDQHTINTLKAELKQVVWIVQSLQERIKIKAELLKQKQLELKQLRQFIKKLSADYPEGPSAFFCTIYRTEYNTKIIKANNNGKLSAN